MQDNISIVITMIIFVTLVVIFPLYNLFERQDDMSYTLALKATTSFIDEIKNNGYIDQTTYNNYISQLSNTGNSYDVMIEAHRKMLIDDLSTTAVTDDYIVQYKIDYTDDILKIINANPYVPNVTGSASNISNAYLLSQDDQIYIKLKNSSVTMAGAIFNIIVPTSKKERIVVNYGGVVKNSSWKKVDSTIQSFTIKPTPPVVSHNGVVSSSTTVDSGMPVNFVATSTPSDWWKKIVSYVYTFNYAGVAAPETQTILTTPTNVTGAITRSFPVATPSTVTVYAVDNYGEKSDPTVIIVNTTSIKPTTPILSSNPDTINNNVIIPIAGGTPITFTASSTPGSAYKTVQSFVWSINNAGVTSTQTIATGSTVAGSTATGTLTVNFNVGGGSVTVYAVDSVGLASNVNGTAFSVMNNFGSQAITGVGLCTMYSIEIPGATVSAYSFYVGVSSGHNSGGQDFWRVEGKTAAGVWENINPAGALGSCVWVSNGVSVAETTLTDQYRYVQLKFEYSVASGHSGCLTSSSAMGYTVKYKFGPVT